MQVNIHDAKTQLSKLIARVEAGEDVVIARSGVPVVRLTRLADEPRPRRVLGMLKGQIWIAPDFDETSDEIMALFNGSESEDP